MRRFLRLVVGSLPVLVGGACGGGGDSVTPPVTVPVSTVVVTPGSAQLTIGATTQLSATTRDADGATLSGRAIAWSSSNSAIASVSGSGLVTAAGAGDAVITASSEGKSGTATIAVSLANFAPATSTTLQGTQRFAKVRIPANVTLTATSALELAATDSLVINGNVVGECVPLTFIAATVVIRGNVDNDCATDPAGDPPVMRIVSGSAIDIGPGDFATSGDILITNDTTLLDSDFPAPQLSAFAPVILPAAATIRGNCSMSGRTFSRTTRNTGTTGQFGGTGRNGRTLRLDCAGDLLLGDMLLQAQHGGHGGKGLHFHINTALAEGGQGGDGGNVRVRALGTIFLSGVVDVLTGNGGTGGDAEATGDPNPASQRAASATARGGAGGAPGLPTFLAGGAITNAPNSNPIFRIILGDAGDGGAAVATAPNGLNADERSGGAQDGGNATATGGAGGSSPDKQLQATSVTVPPQLSGGAGGAGGSATAHAGKGGDGNEQFPPGGEGGRLETTGGNGGNSQLRNLQGNLVSNGGMGGSALGANAMGGNGWSDCIPLQAQKPGGAGGRGGDAFGRGGRGGTGIVAGQDNMVTATNVGIGGNGGHGIPPGDSGARGGDNLLPAKDVTGSFVPGVRGLPCLPPPLILLPGLYTFNAILAFIIGQCPAFATPVSNPLVQFSAGGPFVAGAALPDTPGLLTIHSTLDVVGMYDPADGSFDGSRSGPLNIGGQVYSALERIKGTFSFDENGAPRLTGDLTYQLSGPMGSCQARYMPATWTKNMQ